MSYTGLKIKRSASANGALTANHFLLILRSPKAGYNSDDDGHHHLSQGIREAPRYPGLEGPRRNPTEASPLFYINFLLMAFKHVSSALRSLKDEKSETQSESFHHSHKIKPKFRAAKTTKPCKAKLLKHSRQNKLMVI